MEYDPFYDYLGLNGLVQSFVFNNTDQNPKVIDISPISEPSFPSWPSVNRPPFHSCNIVGRSRHCSDGYGTASSDEETDIPGSPPAAAGLQPFQLAAIMSMSKVYNEQSQRRAIRRKNITHCVFCKNNSEEPEVYNSHTCKSPDGAVTTCPILRAYTCPICGANNDSAHTLKYCPYNKEVSTAAIGFS